MDDSARNAGAPGKGAAVQEAAPSSPLGRPPAAAAEALAQGDVAELARKSNWAGARNVLHVVKATGRFRTLVRRRRVKGCGTAE